MKVEWLLSMIVLPLVCGFLAGFLPITILSWGSFYLWKRERLKERKQEYEDWLVKRKAEESLWDAQLEQIREKYK